MHIIPLAPVGKQDSGVNKCSSCSSAEDQDFWCESIIVIKMCLFLQQKKKLRLCNNKQKKHKECSIHIHNTIK